MMLSELATALQAVSALAPRSTYAGAIIEDNCLAKPTLSTRKLTNQRLGELYALDDQVPLFRVLHRLWRADELALPLVAILCALARDPLLRTTAAIVVLTPPDTEFVRGPVKEAVRAKVGVRLNDAILDKVVRNIASSWTQSGHLQGRTFKFRRLVRATPASLALAVYLGHLAGLRGNELLASGWTAVLDCSISKAQELALEAKRLGLIDLRIGGDVLELNFDRLDSLGAKG
jgi:hypothetical protein